MINPIHSPLESISFHAKPLPKTVTIITKNGKDLIKDEFVGCHCMRTPFLEMVRDLLAGLSNKLGSFKK